MQQQTALTFVNDRGERLAAVLHGPIQPAMAISCHGMFSNKEGIKHQVLADLLRTHGVSLLRFDFAGSGQSEGRFYDVSYSSRMQDLDAALSHLASLGGQRFAVFGSSLGGAVALLSAARDERIVAVATLAAMGHPAALLAAQPQAVADWRARGYHDCPAGRIGTQFLIDSEAHDVVAAVGVLRAPILVVHGDCDTVIPCSDAHDIATAARRASLDLVMGADHNFSDPRHLRPAMQRIAAFLAEQLRQP